MYKRKGPACRVNRALLECFTGIQRGASKTSNWIGSPGENLGGRFERQARFR